MTANDYYNQITHRAHQRVRDRRARKPRLYDWEAEKLLKLFIREHGLKGWKARIDVGSVFPDKEQTFGFCLVGLKQIHITPFCIQRCTPLEIKDTVLHEIAHALVGNGVKHAHGVEWQGMAEKIGVRGDHILDCVIGCSDRGEFD
jgi:hypothetical protein